jgi:hypothetical protein
MTKVEIENKLVNEIHYLPIDVMEAMLKLALSIKKITTVEKHAQANNFVDFIRNSPLIDADIDLERNKSSCRDIEL